MKDRSVSMGPILETFAVPPLGCNCTIVGDSSSGEATVVDPGGDVGKIVDKLTRHGLKCSKILITHGHLDHILGGKELKEKTGAEIIMNSEDLSLYEKVGDQCRDFGVKKPTDALLRPDAFVSDGDVISLTGTTIRCIHCPGHTPGSTSYLFEEAQVCCPGDTLFRGSIGRTSWTGIPSLDGTSDAEQIIGSIKAKLMCLPEETRVICGHGPDTTIGAEKARNMFIR